MGAAGSVSGVLQLMSDRVEEAIALPQDARVPAVQGCQLRDEGGVACARRARWRLGAGPVGRRRQRGERGLLLLGAPQNVAEAQLVPIARVAAGALSAVASPGERVLASVVRYHCSALSCVPFRRGGSSRHRAEVHGAESLVSARMAMVVEPELHQHAPAHHGLRVFRLWWARFRRRRRRACQGAVSSRV